MKGKKEEGNKQTGRENKRKIGVWDTKKMFVFSLFIKIIKLLKLLWYCLSLVYTMYFIKADAIAEIEYKISLLLNHQRAYFDWPPAVDTLLERIYNSHYGNGVPAMFTS